MNLVMRNRYLHRYFTDKCHEVTVLKYLLSIIPYIGIDIKKDELIYLERKIYIYRYSYSIIDAG